eukprot:TRINITY_DN44268_c0_g1_i1.p2 TRINITY_DN44268_c0_g1~~TRINITY_DN44268_c0_g1_i1.p2  ORF type:complete len:162 (+),score=39.15 TRINITY_DN44268_c0_g1_i1:92-577(+)
MYSGGWRGVVFTWCFPVLRVLVPLRFVAMMAHLAALQMVLDSVDQSVAAGFPTWVDPVQSAHLVDAFDTAGRSARAGIALSFVCVCICVLGAFLGMSTLQCAPNLLQAVAHSIAAVLLLTVHYTAAHYARFWHIFFFFTLPAAALEVWILATTLWAREVAW